MQKRYNDWPYGNSNYDNQSDHEATDSPFIPSDTLYAYKNNGYNSVNTVDDKYTSSTNDRLLGTLIARQNCDIEELNDELKAYNQAWQARMKILQRRHREEQGQFLQSVQGTQYSMMTHHRQQHETQYFDYSSDHPDRDKLGKQPQRVNTEPAYIKRVNYEEKHYQKHGGIMPADVF